MPKQNLTFSSLGDGLDERFKTNRWYQKLTLRERGCLSFLLATAPATTSIDASQSLDELTKLPGRGSAGSSSSDGDGSTLCRTLVLKSHVWYVPGQRLLTGVEKCHLQAIPCQVLKGACQMPPRLLTAPAGDAFNAAAFCAMAIAWFVHAPPLAKATDEALTGDAGQSACLEDLVWV